jgi:hypothetical protein
MVEESVDHEPNLIPLNRRHAENLSLYAPDEELRKLQEIAERMGFPCEFIPIGEGKNNLGYFAISKDPRLQAQIVAEAPNDFIDFDDTQGKTTIKKKECWERIEQLRVPREIVKYCDKIARISFQEEHGEMYEPELDKRLLTYALAHPSEDVNVLKEQLLTYLNELLSTQLSVSELFQRIPVHEEIDQIFQDTRHFVELYPDTEEVLKALHLDLEGKVASNIFGFTYGDASFQFEKNLPLLQKGLIQGLCLTKAKKGPFLQQLIKQNPFKALNITYHYPDETQGKGIDFVAFGQPCALTDDDPSQVASVDELADILGIPIEARRVISPDQKRADVATPQGQRVIELTRDQNLRLTQDMVRVQADLFAHALESYLARVCRG